MNFISNVQIPVPNDGAVGFSHDFARVYYIQKRFLHFHFDKVQTLLSLLGLNPSASSTSSFAALRTQVINLTEYYVDTWATRKLGDVLGHRGCTARTCGSAMQASTKAGNEGLFLIKT